MYYGICKFLICDYLKKNIILWFIKVSFKSRYGRIRKDPDSNSISLISFMDLNTLVDLDPGFWPKLNPDPGLCYQ